MFGRDHEPTFDKTNFSRGFEPSSNELMNNINNLSSTLYKILGIDVSNQIEEVKNGEIKYFMPVFNDKNQLVMSLRDYVDLDRNVQKFLRKRNIISVTTDNKDILDLIDEIEDGKNG
ncbi:MAG TPA: hypothetical protein DEQ50_05325 [Lactobacillus sp.]|nr:hypothetical protein [Lactobacillus sp.]